MPHTKSAEKHIRQSEKRRAHNRATKKAIKTQIKRLLDAVREGKPEEIQKEFQTVTRKLDKAAAKRIIHPNLASRKKSRLSKVLQKKAAPAGKQ